MKVSTAEMSSGVGSHFLKNEAIPTRWPRPTCTSKDPVLSAGLPRRCSGGHGSFLYSAPFGMSLCLLLLLSVSVDRCTSFQSNPQQTGFGHRQTTLFVVEPRERTGESKTLVAEIPIVVSHENSLGSYRMSSSAASDEDEDQAEHYEASEDESRETEGRYEDEEAKAQRLANAAKAAALLSRRTGGRSSGDVGTKSTSVGTRRVGSATQARAGTRSMTKLADAVKKAASANTVPKKKDESDSFNGQQGSPSAMITKSMMQATVESMMEKSAAMGLFGEAERCVTTVVDPSSWQIPAPGTVLVQSERSTRPWRPADRVAVRVATLADDLDIANLRLSVFSDFSPDMRKAFCAKSCQVLSSRRSRGATCIVATVPRYGSIMAARPDVILGTAECSFHEFEGTSLGRQRLLNSVLYITEVAVSPTARRKGIGQKIMQSIDELATMRGVETLFLHVDVNNYGALSLYSRSGYTQVPVNDPIYEEFTRSLNLHDGATKGRNHYLLQKHLLPPTWIPDAHLESQQRGMLGFEVAV